METNLDPEADLGRDSLNEFLEKPLPMTGGELSTQNTLSATSLETGGLTGRFIIRKTGEIVVIDENGIESVKINKDGIVISNGTVNLVTINETGIVISNGTIDLVTIDNTGITVNDGTNNRVKLGDIS